MHLHLPIRLALALPTAAELMATDQAAANQPNNPHLPRFAMLGPGDAIAETLAGAPEAGQQAGPGLGRPPPVGGGACRRRLTVTAPPCPLTGIRFNLAALK